MAVCLPAFTGTEILTSTVVTASRSLAARCFIVLGGIHKGASLSVSGKKKESSRIRSCN
jgi:hypothetical protein